MRSAIFRVIAVVAFCWAIFGLLSLLSELKFLIDGLDWSISHVSISYKAVLLEVGRRVPQTVSGYHELVRLLAGLLHLPHLPSFVYDVFSVVAFSVGRGFWLYQRSKERRWVRIRGPLLQLTHTLESYVGLRVLRWTILHTKWKDVLGAVKLFADPVIHIAAICIVYGGCVAIVLAALFGIDFVYRHFS
jgi:hypothetical protein